MTVHHDATGPVPTVADVRDCLDRLYDPALAVDWDAVGLVCGDLRRPVRRVLLAVDPVLDVVDEAVATGTDLLVTHHPLLLHPVHAVATTDPRGLVLDRLVRAGIALLVAHTNADNAEHGVSDALAAAVGLSGTRPLDARPGPALDALAVFVPVDAAAAVRTALAAAGAGTLGDYTEASWETAGTGRFRPGPGARPAIGASGVLESVAETRIDVLLPRAARSAVLTALRTAHPYEEPAFDLHALADVAGRTGAGRVGSLPAPETFGAFVRRVAAAVPGTVAGIRAAGDPAARVATVAVCGGAGDSLLGAAAAAGADVFVTADLRHHPASTARQARTARAGGPAAQPLLVDLTHWASEWPWLPDAAARLTAALTVDGWSEVPRVEVSTTSTDPWTSAAR